MRRHMHSGSVRVHNQTGAGALTVGEEVESVGWNGRTQRRNRSRRTGQVDAHINAMSLWCPFVPEECCPVRGCHLAGFTGASFDMPAVPAASTAHIWCDSQCDSHGSTKWSGWTLLVLVRFEFDCHVTAKLTTRASPRPRQ
jgi:hypothetical protein